MRNRTFKMYVMLCLAILLCSLSIAQETSADALLRRELQSKYVLAQRLERQGQIEQAMRIYEFLSQKDPGNSNYYQSYTDILFRMEAYDKLEDTILRFRGALPKNEQAAVDLGKLYYVKGDTAQAFTYWTQALDEFGRLPSFYRTLFNGMYSLRLFDRAEALIAEARQYHARDDLFALELANYQMLRGKYADSAREYLLFARSNPFNYQLAATQILRFPPEEGVFQTVDSVLVKELLLYDKHPELHRLRAEFLFKFEHYEAAEEEILAVEQLSEFNGNAALDFGADLLQAKEYDVARRFYTQIIETGKFGNITPRLLLGLAETFEKSALEDQSISAWDFFYSQNPLFHLDYIYHIGEENVQMLRAFAIYDSLISRLPRNTYSDQALYRLANLRYLVTKDFDGAYRLYEQAYSISRSLDLRIACKIQMGALLVARGDPAAARGMLTKEADAYEGNQYEMRFRVETMLASFLMADIDTLTALGADLLAMLGPENEQFNDVFEFMNFVKVNYSDADEDAKKAFREFVRGELLLRQNKLSEAVEIYRFLVFNHPQVPIAVAAKFRAAQIDLHFQQWAEAERLVEEIFDGGSDYAEDAAFMLGQVAFAGNDSQRAYSWYGKLMEKFPNSFYIDVVRKRMRQLQNIPSGAPF